MSSSNWWANKMGGTPTPNNYPTQSPPYNPIPQPQVPAPQQPQQPYLPPSATTSSRCPGCGSGNYGGATPEAKARCYDCGYPVVQSGSGMGKGVSQQGSGAPATPARQINTANNFNPNVIIGKLE